MTRVVAGSIDFTQYLEIMTDEAFALRDPPEELDTEEGKEAMQARNEALIKELRLAKEEEPAFAVPLPGRLTSFGAKAGKAPASKEEMKAEVKAKEEALLAEMRRATKEADTPFNPFAGKSGKQDDEPPAVAPDAFSPEQRKAAGGAALGLLAVVGLTQVLGVNLPAPDFLPK